MPTNVLPKPLAPNAENPNPDKYVIVIANDGSTRFACSKNGLLRFSRLYRALSQASDVEELPLRCSAATPEITSIVCMWLNHYGDDEEASSVGTSSTATATAPSRVSYPLQPGTSLSCFLNEWDSKFVENILFFVAPPVVSKPSTSGANPNSKNNSAPPSIMGNCGRIYSLAITATFLQAQILVELCAGVFAFNIREAELESRPVQATSGETVVRSWFGLNGEFSAQERQLVLEQNRDLRDPQGILEKIKELSDEAHDVAAALSSSNNNNVDE